MLAGSGVGPDFQSRSNLHHIHRALGATDLYFVSNPLAGGLNGRLLVPRHRQAARVLVAGDGTHRTAPMFTAENGVTRVVVPLEASGSVFVVFRKHAAAASSIAERGARR